jgi:hypothetical protein
VFLLDDDAPDVSEELFDELRMTGEQMAAVVENLPAAIADVAAVFNAA